MIWSVIQFIISMIVISLPLLVVYMLYRYVFFENEIRRQLWRNQLAQTTNYRNWKIQLTDPPYFEKKFRDIGNPMGINARKYQWFRFIVALILFTQALVAALQGSGFLWMGLPLVWWLFTSQWTPVFDWIYNEFRNRNEDNKNRELYMLYTMIADELKLGTHKKSIYHLIRKLKTHTDVIQKSLNRGLSESASGTEVMMKTISEDIGTSEATIICQMIYDLERSDSEQILSLLKSREEAYQMAQTDKRKKKRSTMGNILASIAFFPLMVYLFNILLVSMQYMDHLQSNMGSFGF